MRPAAELDGDALAGGGGDVEGVAGVPAAGTVDAGAHLGGFDQVLDQSGRADALEYRCRTGYSVPRAGRVERRQRGFLARVDQKVRAEAVGGQPAAVGPEVRHDDRLHAARGERGDGREADRSRANDDRHLARLQARRAHVELADRERVGHGDGVAGHLAGHGLGRRFGNHQQLSETALGVRVLADDPHAACPPSTRRTGMAVTRVPMANWPVQPGPCPTTSPTNS